MNILFLGTSAGTPTRTRNVTSLALQWPRDGAVWLFDCGEGTQHQIMRSPLRLSKIERIFISHLHGDHIFGLPGLLASRAAGKDIVSPIAIHGPEGLRNYLESSLDYSRTHLSYSISFEAVTDGAYWEDDTRTVISRLLAHRIPSYGFLVAEKDRPGHLDAQRATDLGVTAGPDFGRLARGETVTLADGQTVDGATLVGPPRRGLRAAICGDTGPSENAILLARDADVLVHEATFLNEEATRALDSAHSTAADAARIAARAQARALILTHFSSRYESDSAGRMGELLAEAQAIFPNTNLAYDFWNYEVTPGDP